MGDDHATHSDKDLNLGGNTKDPFDSTQYNISCSMMDELETSVLSKYDGPNEKGKTRCDIGVSNDVPSFDLMLSQLTPVDPSPVDPVHVDPIPANPSPVLPSPDKPAQPVVTNTDTEPHPKERRNLRVVKLPEILRSPFVQKKVSLGVKRSKLEDNVASTIFCANKDDCNFVFESTRSGDAVTRVTFESLYPGVDLHVSVLNCWVDVLNSEDQYRNNSDPKRLFTPCLMLVDSHYKDDVEEVDRITSFTENMEICLKSSGLDSLIGVDLLFIPMLHACHYYVICFNLKKAHVFVIDNLSTNVDFDIKYANRPQIMQSTLCSYLVMTSHPIAFTQKTCKPKRLSMPWRTLNNSVDCGVFAMRHMETFKGTSVKEWKCGLTAESDEQQRQLNDLRIKYLAKILLSDINIHKVQVVSEMRAYVNLPNDVKEKMKEGVFERIKDRVRSAL
ncbi:hypothetical protein R6Q59_007159 [Mikania micrantha]